MSFKSKETYKIYETMVAELNYLDSFLQMYDSFGHFNVLFKGDI